MPTNILYHTWFQHLQDLRPGQRITQVRNFAWLMTGIYQSRSVCLSCIAGKIPSRAKLVSLTRRLSRLLNNPAIQVRKWYAPIAREWLEAQHRHLGELRLIVDGTKVGFGHQLLIVGLAYRKRAIPIAWTWVKHVKGYSTAGTQLALLAYVHGLIPSAAAVILVGDSEFGSVAVLRQLDAWGWYYVSRQKGRIHVWLEGSSAWCDFSAWAVRPGQSAWLGRGYLTEKRIYPLNLLAHWQVGEKEPWFLATNLPDRQLTLQAYGRRMWIDEMFGDLKKHGFNLESTLLRHFVRLSRLTLAVVLLYVWLVSTGTRIIRDGRRHWVDRPERRDLSVFQIGLRFMDRCLINQLAFPMRLCSYR